MKKFVRRLRPSRPHISSDTINFKERRDKSFGSAFLVWRACRSMFVSVFVTVECFAPPVKGCLGLVAGTRKRFF